MDAGRAALSMTSLIDFLNQQTFQNFKYKDRMDAPSLLLSLWLAFSVDSITANYIFKISL